MDESTIYALGTPVPSRAHPGAISVIRLSGPRAAEALIFLTFRRPFFISPGSSSYYFSLSSK